MKRSRKKRVTPNRDAHTVALGVALFIGIILLVAAFAKLFYPAESLKTFERWVSVVEILLIVTIFVFRKFWEMWLVAAVIFAAWFGYALFWHTLKLPCNCMGTLFTIPSVFLILLDFLLFAASLVVAYLLGAARKHLQLSIIGGIFMGLAGFAFANWIYLSFISRV